MYSFVDSLAIIIENRELVKYKNGIQTHDIQSILISKKLTLIIFEKGRTIKMNEIIGNKKNSNKFIIKSFLNKK